LNDKKGKGKGKGKYSMKALKALLSVVALIFISVPAFAAVTNLTLVGGCPEPENDPYCDHSGNPAIDNVSILLGLDVTEVSEVTSGFSYDTDEGGKTGGWSVTDSSITHLAFKASGYYILAEVNDSSGDWSTDITQWNPDYLTLTCPVDICGTTERLYEVGDFLNHGGNIAGLSHITAYSAVPIPAAVWLFGSALGMLGWRLRRRKVTG
jgi:hypothetical protein